MAVIRCPHCNKPNPDFLEVCQYCEEPLKEGVTAPPKSAGPEPAGDTGGAAVPDWLRGAEEPAPAAPAAPELKDEPDWMWSGTAGEEAAPAPAAAEVPAWMQGTPEAAPSTAEAPQAAVPDWMQGGAAFAAPAEQQPAAPALETPSWLAGASAFEAASPAPSVPSAPSESEVPEWLRGAPAEAAPAAEPVAALDTPPPDWLSGSSAFGSAPVPAAPTQEETPAWITGADSGAAFTSPAAETPAWTPGGSAEEVPAFNLPAAAAEPAAPAFTPPSPVEETPDWMASLRGAAAPETPLAPADTGTPDWMSGPGAPAAPGTPAASPFAAAPPATPFAAPADSGTPDWMAGLGAPTAAPADSSPPDWMAGLGAPAAPPAASPFAAPADTGTPDWMAGLAAPAASSAPAASPFAAPSADSNAPDWLSSLASAPAAPAEAPAPFPPSASEETPDWMKDLGSPGAPEGEPDWLSGIGSTPSAAVAAPTAPAVSPFAAPPPNLPDWMQAPGEIPAAPAEATGTPDWLTPAAGAAAAGLFGAEIPAAPSPAPASAPAPAMPGWLAAMRPKDSGAAPAGPTPRPAAPAIPAAAGAVAPTALPSWLQAMRPVDVTPAAGAPEKDAYEETVGILAGMRGVLRAEPVVTLPTKTVPRVHELEVTKETAAAAEIITTLFKEDAEAAPASQRRFRLAIPFDRLLVVVVLAFVVGAVPVVAPGLFPLPTTIAPETLAAFNLIETAPVDKPVLVAFDYDAGQMGELSPAAETLLAHLMRRGAPLVAVSTRPAGAPIADAELRRLAAAAGYEYGANYLNLGYIPGGAVGLLQFAAAPQSLFTYDFSGALAVWQLPLAQHITRLGDFGLIILVEASPDSARAWIEQTGRFADGVPVLAAVSAGAAPLVRPYSETNPPQIHALVSGIIGAAQYEQQAGLPGAASARWNAMNGGLLIPAGLIAAGSRAGGVLRLAARLRGRRRRPTAKKK